MTGNPTEETPRSSEELMAEIAQIDQEIAELTKEDPWQQLGQAAEQAQAAEKYLGSVIDEITETGEGIKESVDLASVGKTMEELLEIPEVKEAIEKVKGGLKSTTNVLEEIKGGVGKFNEFLSILQRGEGLTSGNAPEQLQAAGEVYVVFVSKLEPFIDKVPVLGAFVQIWGLSISRAAEVAGVEVERVDRLNDSYADPHAVGRPGRHLYSTDETRKADKIRKLKEKRSQLYNEAIEAAGDERTAATDLDAQTEPTYRDHAIEDAIQQSSGAQVPPRTDAYTEWGNSTKNLDTARVALGRAQVDFDAQSVTARDAAAAANSYRGADNTLAQRAESDAKAEKGAQSRLDGANSNYDAALDRHSIASAAHWAEVNGYRDAVKANLIKIIPGTNSGRGFSDEDYRWLALEYPQFAVSREQVEAGAVAGAAGLPAVDSFSDEDDDEADIDEIPDEFPTFDSDTTDTADETTEDDDSDAAFDEMVAQLPAQSGFESDEDIDLDEFSPEPADSRTLGIPLAGVVAAAVLLAVALGAFIVFNIGSGDPVAQLEVPATGQSAEAGDPVAQLEVPATGQSAEAGDPDAAPAGGGAAGPPQLPPDTPVDKLMVVRVGGGSTDGDEGDLLPIHQFMVTPPHAPTIIVRFSGEDDLNVFPDQLVYTDDSYQGDPATACRDPHFHMPEFMPTGMNIEGIIIPEPNAQGCGYGRVSEAFPIQVPTTISDAWEEQAGWDPRTGEPLVELLVIMTPAVTDQAVDAKMLVTIQNVGQVPWSTIEFDDSTFGGLLGPNADLLSNDCTGPIALAPFETKKCSYGVHVDRTMSISAEVAAPKPGDLDATELREIFTTSVDISVRDEDGNIGGDSYAPLMYFSSYFAALEVEKASDPQTLEDPGPVEFTVTIRNGGTETFDLVQVVDTQYGDLLNEMNPRVTKSDCPDLPRVIEPNQEFDCSFVGEVGSNQEDGNHLNEVFVTVVNPSSEFGTASAELRIPITNPGPVDTSGLIMWDLFLAEGVIDEIPDGVGK